MSETEEKKEREYNHNKRMKQLAIFPVVLIKRMSPLISLKSDGKH